MKAPARPSRPAPAPRPRLERFEGELPRLPLPHPNLGDPKVYELARQIFFRRFSAKVRHAGLDPDDAFQTVCVGLLSRSTKPCRWDPERGALSNWLFVATRSLVSNLLDAHRRSEARFGSLGTEEDLALTVLAVEEPDEEDPE